MTVIPNTVVRGLGDLEAALTRGQAQAALAARANVQVAALELIREAQSDFAGAHRKGQPHVPNPNNYPNVVTGTLRRSISSDGIKSLGPALYSTTVGPRTVYARRVELGLHPTGAYPYFGPAVKRVRARIGTVAASNWARLVRF